MTFALRDYQAEALSAVRRFWAERSTTDRAPLVAHATGLGKTELGLAVVVSVLDEGGRVVWLAHRAELVNEPFDRLTRHWPRHGFAAGVVKSNRDAVDAPCVFASTQTLERPARRQRLLDHGHPALIVVDEAHHYASSNWRAVVDALRGPETKLLGLTATPSDDLGDHWEIVHHRSIVDGIAGGWLVDPFAHVRILPGVDRAKISGGRRDYDDAEAGAELLKKHIVDETVKALSEVAYLAHRLPRRSAGPREGADETRLIPVRDRYWCVFTHTVEQAQLTAAALKDAGWRAAWMSGDTPADDRKRLLRAVRMGQVQVICNAGVLLEGTDMPRVDGIVLARAFQSRTLFIQGVGRGLRLFDAAHDRSWLLNAHDPRYAGKRDCLIIDLVGATEEVPLVVAPLLTASAECPGGRHEWEESVDGRGFCAHPDCDARIACFKARGPHLWSPVKRCRFCDAEQCPNNPEHAGHKWIRQPDYKRQCEFCEAIVPDPLASLVGRAPVDDSALLNLELDPETWGVDLGTHGVLLVTGTRQPDEWVPWWVPNLCPPQRLMSAPVPGWHAWAVAKDLVTRARRVMDARLGREVFGGHGSEEQQESFRERARALALQLGVARAVAA